LTPDDRKVLGGSRFAAFQDAIRREGEAMVRSPKNLLIGQRVSLRHGFLWMKAGQGTIRATYQKQGRLFATVELDGTGERVPRLMNQLRVVDDGR
jgi:hypothetical protein